MNILATILAWGCLAAIGVVIALTFHKEGGIKGAITELKGYMKEGK